MLIWYLFEQKTSLAITLAAMGPAYAVMAVVMHLWTNEAVAILWWLCAGMTIVNNRKDPEHR